ncbi:MAG: tetratricopeptide repeat protein [Bacteroidota bacterium]
MSKLFLTVALLTCLINSNVFSQTSWSPLQYDSLFQVAHDPGTSQHNQLEALLAFMTAPSLASQYDSLLTLSQTAVLLAQQLETPGLLARALESQGNALFSLTRFKEALPIYQQGLEAAQQTTDTSLIGTLIRSLGSAEYETGSYAAAESHLLQAKALHMALKDDKAVAKSLGTMLNLYNDTGRYDEAITAGKQALALFQDSSMISGVLGNLSNPFIYTGQYDSALMYTQRALEIQQALKDTGRQAVSYATLGNISLVNGDLETALTYHQLASVYYETVGKIQGVALSQANMGYIHLQQADYQKALVNFQKASKVFEEQENPSYQSSCLVGIGEAYFYTERYEEALTYFQKALALRENLNMQYGIAEVLGKIGITYSDLEKAEESLAAYQRALSISKSIGDKKSMATNMAYIGSLYKKQGKPDKALSYFEESLTIREEYPVGYGMATILAEMAEIYLAQGKMKAARRVAEKGLVISKESRDLRSQNNFARILYQTYKALNDPKNALAMNELYHELQDSLDREENQQAIFKYEYEQKALEDSIQNLQELQETELAFQKKLSQRNTFLFAALALLGLGVLGFLFFRNQQKIRLREQELSLQEERAEQAQLRELDNLKNRFFTNISHEFRTPLTVILGMADQLPAPQDQERSLIRRNGRRLLRLINQLLDLARLESHELRFQWVQGDIVGYLRYLTESFQSLAEERKIQLSVYTEVEKIIMDYDAEKVQDIVYNLLSNALKFTTEGEKIVMYIGQEVKEDQAYMRCMVQDTGSGIPSGELPFIFDRFYQGSASSNETSTGVGLALVKGLLEKMGGDISVESKVGNGAVFTFTLPIIQRADTPAAFAEVPLEIPSPRSEAKTIVPESYASSSTDQQRVLIIEDNPDVITYLGAILGPDYHLLTATDGVSGVALAQEQIPDLVITDVMMPGMNGYEVTQALKTDERTSHIPIIMLTAKATQDDKVAGLEYGADAYLTKPFDKAELLVRIEKLLEIRQTLQEKFGQKILETPVVDVPKAPSLDEIFIQKIQRVILAKISEPELSVYDLCEAVNLARTQVYRKVKALSGKSPTLYIRAIRLEKAKELLQTTHLTISEIAYDVGFNDPGYFTRVFHEVFGQTPSQIRETK